MEKRKNRLLPVLLEALAVGLVLLGLDYWNLLPHRTYTAEDFGIETLQSPLDADGDGIDDYTDILLGARRDAENHPKYDPGYFAGGYPPEATRRRTGVSAPMWCGAPFRMRATISRH